MFELGYQLIRRKFFPLASIDLSADPFNVKKAPGRQEAFRIEADAVDVIISRPGCFPNAPRNNWGPASRETGF